MQTTKEGVEMLAYSTPSLTTRGWTDIHMDGRSHRNITWQERYEMGTDGRQHLISHIYADGNINVPVTDIPMNAERSRDRIRYVFEALDAAGHPTDTNVAFDFSIVEADIMSILEKEIDNGNTNVALPDFLMEDDTVYITVNPDGYTVSTRYLYQKVETLREVAALLAREMYPAAAKYEHMPRG